MVHNRFSDVLIFERGDVLLGESKLGPHRLEEGRPDIRVGLHVRAHLVLQVGPGFVEKRRLFLRHFALLLTGRIILVRAVSNISIVGAPPARDRRPDEQYGERQPLDGARPSS